MFDRGDKEMEKPLRERREADQRAKEQRRGNGMHGRRGRTETLRQAERGQGRRKLTNPVYKDVGILLGHKNRLSNMHALDFGPVPILSQAARILSTRHFGYQYPAHTRDPNLNARSLRSSLLPRLKHPSPPPLTVSIVQIHPTRTRTNSHSNQPASKDSPVKQKNPQFATDFLIELPGLKTQVSPKTFS